MKVSFAMTGAYTDTDYYDDYTLDDGGTDGLILAYDEIDAPYPEDYGLIAFTCFERSR